MGVMRYMRSRGTVSEFADWNKGIAVKELIKLDKSMNPSAYRLLWLHSNSNRKTVHNDYCSYILQIRKFGVTRMVVTITM